MIGRRERVERRVTLEEDERFRGRTDRAREGKRPHDDARCKLIRMKRSKVTEGQMVKNERKLPVWLSCL